MTLKANRESTDEIASTEKSDSDVNSKDFTCEQAQAINSSKSELILSDKKKQVSFYSFENGEAIQLRVPPLGRQQKSDGKH